MRGVLRRGSRVPDRPERRDPQALETVDDAPRAGLVAHPEGRLRVELASRLVCELDEVGLPALRRDPNDGVGLRGQRGFVAAQTTTAPVSATRLDASTTVVGETPEDPRERAAIATPVKAKSHAVPASAPPTWTPPMWFTLEMLHRSHKGHDREPDRRSRRGR